METLAVLRDTIREKRGLWLGATSGFVALYYLGLLATVVLRLGHLPNYATFYDWPANVWTIIRSTPSVRDVPPIIAREWLFETGYITMSYGHGIAVWSLAIVPAKVASVTLLGALAATSLLLLRRLRATCPAALRGGAAASTGMGALFVGVTNVTMSWVACCSTPSWVVGLSLIGIETSSAYALLPYGNALSLTGFAILLATNYMLARRCLPPSQPAPSRQLAVQDL